MSPLAQVHRDGARRGYIDARVSARPRGVHPRTLQRHLRCIGWQPWMPGLWVPGEDDPPYLVRCRIVLAAFGPDALLTGATALWALDILRHEPDDVELLLTAGRHVRARDGICVHNTADLAAVRRLAAQGLQIAGTVRAVADHARHTGMIPLCRVIADAERLRHCTLRQIGEELDRRVRFPGKAVLGRAHGELCGELNHSGNERLGRRLLQEVGVAVASRPGPIVHRERIVAEGQIGPADPRYRLVARPDPAPAKGGAVRRRW